MQNEIDSRHRLNESTTQLSTFQSIRELDFHAHNPEYLTTILNSPENTHLIGELAELLGCPEIALGVNIESVRISLPIKNHQRGQKLLNAGIQIGYAINPGNPKGIQRIYTDLVLIKSDPQLEKIIAWEESHVAKINYLFKHIRSSELPRYQLARQKFTYGNNAGISFSIEDMVSESIILKDGSQPNAEELAFRISPKTISRDKFGQDLATTYILHLLRSGDLKLHQLRSLLLQTYNPNIAKQTKIANIKEMVDKISYDYVNRLDPNQTETEIELIFRTMIRERWVQAARESVSKIKKYSQANGERENPSFYTKFNYVGIGEETPIPENRFKPDTYSSALAKEFELYRKFMNRHVDRVAPENMYNIRAILNIDFDLEERRLSDYMDRITG